MFVLAGLGQKLEDIPLGVKKYIKKADTVFLEKYTSIPEPKTERYLLKLRKDLKYVDREFVETKLENFLLENKNSLVMLLVPGHPLFATTHLALLSFCKENGIKFKVIGASSVFDYVAKTGSFIYKFGKVGSISFHDSRTPYEILKYNTMINAHTLFLLDLDPKNNRFLSVAEALLKLLELEEKEGADVIILDKKIVVCERLGTENERIHYLTVKSALDKVFSYPACIIVPAELNPIEEEFLKCMSSYFEK
jgi:diphthine synthase